MYVVKGNDRMMDDGNTLKNPSQIMYPIKVQIWKTQFYLLILPVYWLEIKQEEF